MRIEHIALWAEDIELLKDFYYFCITQWKQWVRTALANTQIFY